MTSRDFTDREIGELIESARQGGDAAVAAARQLGLRGASALPAVIEGLSNPWVQPGELPTALKRIYENESTEYIDEGLRVGGYHVFKVALDVLQERYAPDSRQVLVDCLQDETLRVTRRAEVMRACGEVGDVSLVPVVENTLGESIDIPRGPDETPVLLVESILALAKLGTFTHGEHLLSLLEDPYVPTRSMAVQAMETAISERMLNGLTSRLADSASEVRLAAVQSLFLLGVPATLEPLLWGMRCEDADLRNNCRVRLNDISGESFAEDDVDALQARCAEMASLCEPDLRYRSGEPFSVSGLMRLVQPGNPRNSEILRELELATGTHFSMRSCSSPAVQADVESRFPLRRPLYRWGHLIPAELFL